MDERKVQREQQKCNLFIEDRNRLTVTAVEDIDAFDESGFTAITNAGALMVKGTDLHINKLNVDTGELVVDGDIDSCIFNNNYGGKGGGFISRLFK